MQVDEFERIYPIGLLDDIDSVPEGFGAIYLITNLVNGKVYVGQTWQRLKKRWYRHKAEAKNGNKRHLYASLRLHGSENFTLELLGLAVSQQRLDELESLWIEAFRSTNPTFGYNEKEGGKGGKHTPETRKRIVQALQNPSVRAKQSASAHKKWSSLEEREKQADLTRKQWEDPNFKATQTKRLTEHWQQPEIRAKGSIRVKEQWQQEGYREDQSKKMRLLWEDEEYRVRHASGVTEESTQRMSEAAVKAWENQEYRNARVEDLRNRWKNPEYKERHSKRMIQLWSDPEYKAKRLANSLQKGRTDALQLI